ncbi:type II toxin-antitoxin system RelE/ParE family toxin [Kumtagia ephedrae]|uniref:Toxin n=1 Tax=Kumtagia ephedrae TaxID=2116701 RepID=A0A2P7STI3_9HYPH|nr:type II toxin-antitoxin system RelE/ParE family toxin [Mesorhizobium ephedrae]PSJ65792.1 type II toxin-antitoxin system RelE/ParE family toxin [Mesorhizobium ephedrae]
MSRYRLSERADIDLLNIFIYGVENFGERQAKRYKGGLEGCFELLATQPRMGRLAGQFGTATRRHAHGSHVIFYEIEGDSILILTVIDGRALHGLDL